MRNVSPVVCGVLAVTLVVAGSATPAEAEKPPAVAMVVAGGSALSHDVLMIARVRDQWLEAVNAADLSGILSAYGPGAVVLPEALSPLLGARNIGRWHQRWLPLADVTYSLQETRLHIDGDWAFEEWLAEVTVAPRGDANLAVGDDPLQFRQGGVRVYRKDARGRWRIDRETWSADHPATRQFAELRLGGCTPRLC